MSGVSITNLRDTEGTTPMWTADRKLWLTADRDRVVEDGDPEADSLYCTPGYQVPLSEAKALGANVSEEGVLNVEKPLTAPAVAEAKRAAQPTESPEALAAAVQAAKQAESERLVKEAELLAGEDLKDKARELDIEGRSNMTADELREAVALKQAETPDNKQRDAAKNK